MTADERFDRMERSIEKLTLSVAERFDNVAERFDNVAERLDRFEKYLLDFRREAAERFESIDRRLDGLVSVISRTESLLPQLTGALLDLGTFESRVLRAQWQQKDVSADLAASVAKLEETVSKLVDPAA